MNKIMEKQIINSKKASQGGKYPSEIFIRINNPVKEA